MSRSRKKIPITKEGGPGVKQSKKIANRKIRRKNLDEDSPHRKSNLYKRFFQQYDIHDWISLYTEKDAIKDWYDEELGVEHRKCLHNKYKSLREWLSNWYKERMRK